MATIRHAVAQPQSFAASGLAQALNRREQEKQLGVKITDREAAVLRLLADGYPVKAVARRLAIAESTAKTHVAKLYRKLEVSNRAAAIRAAYEEGLLGEEPIYQSA